MALLILCFLFGVASLGAGLDLACLCLTWLDLASLGFDWPCFALLCLALLDFTWLIELLVWLG